MSVRVLLLQSPYGPLFTRLEKELEKQGCTVFRVALNGGDELFASKKNLSKYVGGPDDWPSYIDSFIDKNAITNIVCFSDCRIYHKAAKQAAIKFGATFWVLEEGYLRPDFFTLEKGGVNALSEQNLSIGEIKKYTESAQASPYKVNGTYINRASFSAIYYIAKRLRQSNYPLYLHHRSRTEWEEFLCWRLSDLRKLKHKFTERGFFEQISDKKVFVLVLQMHEDFQLREHSPYSSMTEVINEVMTSFAEFADPGLTLVIKHHPMDRGFHHYGAYIAELKYSLRLKGRVKYVHDVHLPTLLKSSRGVVTVNSTVGLSALVHRCPVKVLGEAIYDLPEITFQESLNRFWSEAEVPDAGLVSKLVAYLRNTTQFNGSLHKNLSSTAKKVAERILLEAVKNEELGAGAGQASNVIKFLDR